MVEIKDILTPKEIISINKWDMTKPLFIYGDVGVGKSSLARLIFEQKNIFYNDINTSFLKKGKSLLILLDEIINRKSISLMLQQQSKGILIDDLDSIDKNDNIISKLTTTIKTSYANLPYILTCNKNFISSNIQKLEKISFPFHLKSPNVTQMVRSVNHSNKDILKECAKKSNGDWNTFQQLILFVNNKESLNNIDTKRITLSINNTYNSILNNKYNVKDIFVSSSADNNLISLISFTNTYDIMKNTNDLAYVYQNFCHYDLVEKHDEDLNLYNISILFGIVLPTYYCQKYLKKKYESRYTHVFSVSTTQLNYRKLIHKIKYYMNNSITALSTILYKSLSDSRAKEYCLKLDLREFTLNELKKIIKTKYDIKFSTEINKKLLALINK